MIVYFSIILTFSSNNIILKINYPVNVTYEGTVIVKNFTMKKSVIIYELSEKCFSSQVPPTRY